MRSEGANYTRGDSIFGSENPVMQEITSRLARSQSFARWMLTFVLAPKSAQRPYASVVVFLCVYFANVVLCSEYYVTHSNALTVLTDAH